MPWDLALDGVTGDFLFGANRDLLGVMDAPLVNQRILVRCKIPLGSFQADEEQTLGSAIPLMDSMQHATDSELISAVQAALQPMTDIQIEQIEVFSIDNTGHLVGTEIPVKNNRRVVQVTWTPISGTDEPADESETPLPTYDATVTF